MKTMEEKRIAEKQTKFKHAQKKEKGGKEPVRTMSVRVCGKHVM